MKIDNRSEKTEAKTEKEMLPSKEKMTELMKAHLDTVCGGGHFSVWGSQA